MLLLGNGTVLTLDGDSTVIEDGGVVIRGEKIIATGKTDDLKEEYPEAEYRDVTGKIIMPGMINTHTHLYSTFARGMDLKVDTPPQNFVEILEKLWWRLDYNLNQDDLYYSALYGIIDCLKNGTTTIFDHHASYGIVEDSLDIIARVVEKTGIRANLAYEISDRHGPEKSLEAIKENERFLHNINSKENKYLTGTIGLHASFTLEEETLKNAVNLSQELTIPFHIHTAEGKADLEDSRCRGYGGVVKRLDNYGIWQPGTLAIHGVHLQPEELEILSERGVYLIHNPESNMNNAVGMSPVKEALNKGITAGLGTDGYTADMFESIQVANLLQKHEQKHPGAGGEEIYRLAFENNRKIAADFFAEKIGIIEPGAVADIITVDYNPPTPINSDNVFTHLLFGFNGGLVDTVIIGGQILLENQEVKGFDYQGLSRQVRQQAADFWQRFN